MEIREAKDLELHKISEIMFEGLARPPYNVKKLRNIADSLDFYFRIGRVYVAIINGEIAGVLIFKKEIYWEGPAFVIVDLIVKDEFDGKNVGNDFMEFLESEAKRNKIVSIYFSTNRSNKAIEFYKKYGFKEEKDTIFMRKKLG